MKRRFKTKHSNHFFIKTIIYIGVICALSNCLFTSISHDFNFLENPIHNFSIDRNKMLLKMGLNYKEKLKEKNTFVFKEEKIKPKLYLYNSHQTEEYNGYTLVEATNYLRSLLTNAGVDVVIDDIDIESIILKNNLKYKDSYKITRDLILNKNVEEFRILIDLHRDSSKRDVTTTTINNVNYAKVMFVVGGNHSNYMNNYKVMDDLNKMVKNINPSLSRGIFLRKSSNFNQDVNKNIILIELGGVENTKEEVNNSVEILSKVLADYLME